MVRRTRESLAAALVSWLARHCERSEAIYRRAPGGGLLRLRLAMTVSDSGYPDLPPGVRLPWIPAFRGNDRLFLKMVGTHSDFWLHGRENVCGSLNVGGAYGRNDGLPRSARHAADQSR